MAVLLRLDVDRPFGKKDFSHQLLSRISSDYCFPRFEAFSYLSDLKYILNVLNKHNVRSYVFFRRCTYPSKSAQALMEEGQHVYGLHLEDSRNFESFTEEHKRLEHFLGRRVLSFSKHGSGEHKYGWSHFAPYEPGKYVDWGNKSGMRIFLGNQENPSIGSFVTASGQTVFPAAFWLEPYWRDVKRFTIDWLVRESCEKDIVLLAHPDNVTASRHIMDEFLHILQHCPIKTDFGEG